MLPHAPGPRLEVVDASGHVDTIRAIFVYAITTVTVVGGGVMLYLTRSEVASDDLRIMLAGFIGSALTFAFGQEVQTRTARQAATATAANAAAKTAEVAAANGGVGAASFGLNSEGVTPVEIVNPDPVPVVNTKPQHPIDTP